MFKRVVFWCEFPEETDWSKLEKLLKELDMNIKIYVPVKNLNEFLILKRLIQKKCGHVDEVNVWPVLSKENGYWFSGFTKSEDIKKLKQFSTLSIKIDLELPIPKKKYSNMMLITYLGKYLFHKGPNNKQLYSTIKNMSENTNIILNEFPFPRFLLKRWGIHMPIMKNCTKNIMSYTTIGGRLLRPLTKLYLFIYLLRERLANKNIMCSIGLIGKGILKNEGVYDNVHQFKSDLDMARFLRIKQVAIYSIDSILKRKNPKEWLIAVKARTRI